MANLQFASQMYRCKAHVTTHQLIYTDLLLLSVFQMQKPTSLDKNAAKEPSHDNTYLP